MKKVKIGFIGIGLMGYPMAKNLLKSKYTFSDKIRNKILRNTHGDSSGVRGAAWLWDSDKF